MQSSCHTRAMAGFLHKRFKLLYRLWSSWQISDRNAWNIYHRFNWVGGNRVAAEQGLAIASCLGEHQYLKRHPGNTEREERSSAPTHQSGCRKTPMASGDVQQINEDLHGT